MSENLRTGKPGGPGSARDIGTDPTTNAVTGETATGETATGGCWWERGARSPRRRPLPKARQRALLRAYKEHGDIRAKQRLIESSMGLIAQIAWSVGERYAALRPSRPLKEAPNGCVEGTIVHVEDLKQEGALAFARAIDDFDENAKTELTSFAGAAVRNSLYKVLERSRYVPYHNKSYRSFTGALTQAKDDARMELGREPTEDELAHRMGRDARWVREVSRELAAAGHPYALETLTDKGSAKPSGDHRHSGFGIPQVLRHQSSGQLSQPESQTGSHTCEPSAEETFLAREAACSHEERLEDLKRALGGLNPADKQLLCLLYGVDGSNKTTATALARQHGFSRQRLYQLRSRAVRRMRELLQELAHEEQRTTETAQSSADSLAETASAGETAFAGARPTQLSGAS